MPNGDFEDGPVNPNPEAAALQGVGAQGGHNTSQIGVFGSSPGNYGVYAMSGSDVGLLAKGGRLAARFEGDVEVTGDVKLVNADCAEDFDVAVTEVIEPGTVVVLGEEGVLRSSCRAYDKRVAGVISGAGGYKPALVLDKRHSSSNRRPVALLGKVFCKVDAQYGPIEVGDLLTTSPTVGHAMKATDSQRAFGAVLGKALRPLETGRGLVPILVTLQ